MLAARRLLLIVALAVGAVGCPPPGRPAETQPSLRHSYDSQADPRKDISEALRAAEGDRKLVLLIFGANWCPACWDLSALFEHATVRRLIQDNFRVVPIDIGDFNRNNDVVRQYVDATEEGIPAVVVLTATGEVLAVTKGNALARAARSPHTTLRYLRDCVASATSATAPPDPPVTPDSTQIRNHVETFVQRVAGESVATSVFQVAAGPDSVVSTILQGGAGQVWQRVIAVLDPRSLRPRHVVDSAGGVKTDLTYAAGRIRGTRIAHYAAGSSAAVSVNLPDSSTFDRRTLFAVIPALPLAPRWRLTVPVFDAASLRSVPVRISVTGRQRITVPAGTFDAYRVSLTGDAWGLPVVLYVSTLSPRRVIRLERPGQRAVFEVLN